MGFNYSSFVKGRFWNVFFFGNLKHLLPPKDSLATERWRFYVVFFPLEEMGLNLDTVSNARVLEGCTSCVLKVS